MLLKYILTPTVLYMEDVEAVGGGVLLEKIKESHKGIQVFDGTLYMCGHHWKVELIHYKRGKGRITKIEDSENQQTEPLEKIKKLMTEKMFEKGCPLLQIRSRRAAARIKGNILYVLSIIAINEAIISYLKYNNEKFLYIFIASALILLLSIRVTNIEVRG